MRIIFFNQYHNGDCFVGKGWVRNIINQIPNVDFFYAHGKHPDLLKDLGCTYMPIHQLKEVGIKDNIRIAQSTVGDIYINTWCGAFQGELFGHDEHSNYIIQHIMYSMYCRVLKQEFNLEVHQSSNPHDYLPFIDFSYYNTKPADDFVASLNGKDLTVFCNGPSLSGQSTMGDMKNIIDALSDKFPDKIFVTTQDIGIKKNNIRTTNEIFNQECDINEIAYLTKFAKVIVGKNSGPSTFSLYDENLRDKNKTIFCFGTKLTDWPPAGLEFPTKFKFSNQQDDRLVTEIISRTLSEVNCEMSGVQHITI